MNDPFPPKSNHKKFVLAVQGSPPGLLDYYSATFFKNVDNYEQKIYIPSNS